MKPETISSYFDILGKAQKAYGRLLEPVCRRWALTRNELDVMLFLHNNPQYTRATDIVSHRGLTKSHVSMSVANLAERGLLIREYSAADRRTAHLTLSETGAAIAREAREQQDRFFARLYEGIAPEEAALMQGTVKKIIENVDNFDNSLTTD